MAGVEKQKNVDTPPDWVSAGAGAEDAFELEEDR